MKKILASLSIIAAAGAIAAGGTFAIFSDTETSSGNTFTAGTLDLALSTDGTTYQNGSSIPALINIAANAGFKPGDSTSGFSGSLATKELYLKNIGSVTGKLSGFSFGNAVFAENGCGEPEVQYSDPNCPTSTPTSATGGRLQKQVRVKLTDADTSTVVYDGLLSGLSSFTLSSQPTMATGVVKHYLIDYRFLDDATAADHAAVPTSTQMPDTEMNNWAQSDSATFDFNAALVQQ